MQKRIFICMVVMASLSFGPFMSQSEAQTLRGAASVLSATQNFSPVDAAACRGWGRWCRPGYVRTCGPWRCWCRPCW